jgi:hypothetical protein
MKISKFSPILNDVNFSSSHRKNVKAYIKSFNLVTFDTVSNKFSTLLDIRVYQTNSVIYVCMWFSYNGIYTSSSIKLNERGFDCINMGIEMCLNRIGIYFNEPINDDLRQGLNLVAKELGYNNSTVIETYA